MRVGAGVSMVVQPLSEVLLGLNMFGGASVRTSDGVDLPVAGRKSLALVAYLALTRTGSESRERLAGLLWSGNAEDQARASLRQCVKQLRGGFDSAGFAGFATTRTDLRLDLAMVRTDLAELKEGLRRGIVPASLLDGSTVPENLLYGYESLDLLFASWLQVVRKTLHDDLLEALEEIMRSGRHGMETAERAASALVRIDPTHEEAQRCLIRAHARRGNTSAALDQYKRLWDLLEEEYDMEPAPETEALIVSIKAGSYVAEADTPAAGQAAVVPPSTGLPAGLPNPATLPVIGMAKFARGGAWNQDGYLIDGFRRDLISSLVRFREWIVVEVSADPDGEPRSGLGQPQGRVPDYLLEGAYFEENGEVHLIITLKETGSGRYIWSEIINLTLDGWFASRRQVISRVSISMSVYLSAGRLSELGEPPSIPLEIYDRWLRGQGLIYNWRPDTHRTAQDVFQQIIDRAPTFSPAYSSQVQLLNSIHIVSPGTYRTAERHRQSLHLAKTAVDLDPLDSRAQLCLGWAYAMNSRFEQSVLHHNMARELNGNDIWTLVSAGLGLAYEGTTAQATAFADQALMFAPNLTPLQWAYIAGVRYQSGDYDACIQAADRAGSRAHYLFGWKASALAHLGKSEEARVAYDQFFDLAVADWAGEGPASRPAVEDWLLHCFPIRDAARRRLQTGLESAGAALTT